MFEAAADYMSQGTFASLTLLAKYRDKSRQTACRFIRFGADMKYFKKCLSIFFLSLIVLQAASYCVYSDDQAYNKIDVTQFFDMTYSDIIMSMDGFYESIDSFGSGKTFLTNGKIAFYFEYDYGEDIHNMKVNRIVITNNDTGSFFLGDEMCIAATYTDEHIYMETEGFECVCTLGDLRKVWVSDSYVAIVSRGPYAGCCEIDISKNADGSY